jgi:beta-lactamase regulating signal transducer with metallopeptidase domain
VLACTALLGLGALAVSVSRAPLHRHRLAELTCAGSLALVALLVLPLPRPATAWLAGSAAAAAPARPATESVPPYAPIPLTVRTPPSVRSAPADPRAARAARRVPIPGAPPAPAASLVTDELLAGLFLAGGLAFALHLALSYALLRRTLARAAPAPEWIARLVAAGPGRAPRVVVSARVARPFCCGLRRGAIVLPAALARPELAGRVEAVLRHEHAHLVQRHPRARLLAALCAPCLYWHPLYWWLARELRRTAELLADDMAAAQQGKRRYVEELIELATHTRRALMPQAARLDVLGPRKEFQKRMETLLMRQSRLATRSSAGHVLARSACALLVLGTVSIAWGRTPQDTDVRDPRASDVPVREAPARADARIVVDPRGDDFFLPARASAGRPDAVERAADPRDPLLGGDFFLPGRGRAGRSDAVEGTDDPLVRSRRPVQDPRAAALPRVTLEFQVDDARALGELVLRCADAGLAIESLDVGAPGRSGARKGEVVLGGVSDRALNGLATPRAGFRPLSFGVQQDGATMRARLEPESASAAPSELARISAQLEALTRRLDQLEHRDGPRNPIGDPEAGAPIIRGRVIETHGAGEQRSVCIDRGAFHGVQQGDVFELYRQSVYKGRVRVVEVHEDYSKSVIELEGRGTIAEGDSATSRL